ncbi:MAG TPA: His/Gly/Thr/Pro-type tRNA ligase C-terminal domain-containing protein, partial [Myxococcota bacterium]|nr:His/Gly/Thr/Pro-type tRNA ligase C-terminal domain-containing protein [Myxococcota bacterium]
ADFSLHGKTDMVSGSNKKDIHYLHVDMARDSFAEYFDIRKAKDGDPCGQCGAPFTILRGIEVGHIFYLGKKYSKAMHATVQNEHGEVVEMEMGCYGIGVGRTAAAAIEQNHDERGIIWPPSIAPYHIHLVQLGVDPELSAACEEIYRRLEAASFEVLFDDRDERAGVKFNDADLIGCPVRIALGNRGLKNREIEVLPRGAQNQGPIMVSLESDYVDKLQEILALCRTAA